MTRLKHFLRLQYGSALAADVRHEGDVHVYGSNGPVGTHNRSNMLSPSIVVGRKGSHGKVVWAEEGGYCIDTALFIDRRFCSGNLRYAYYLLQALKLDESSKDSAVPGLDRSEAHDKMVPSHDSATQKAIADFLDRETARIDQLIKRKQRMISLALEGQAARLDQFTFNSSMASGWSHVPFKWICRIPSGQVDPTVEPWADMPLIAPNHIESNTGRILSIESAREQAAESGKYTFPSGTVLYSKIRPALAKACIAPRRGLCSADMYPIIPSSDLIPTYLLMQLLSRSFTEWAVLESMRVAMPKINRESLGQLRLVVPPIETQQVLVDSWFVEANRTSRLVNLIRKSIEKLQELRSSLINAAVTGQIDVTTWGKRDETERRIEAMEEAV